MSGSDSTEESSPLLGGKQISFADSEKANGDGNGSFGGDQHPRPSLSHSNNSNLNKSFRSFLGNLTKSQRDAALQRPGVGTAALLIRDAVLGEEPQEEEYDELLYDPYQSVRDDQGYRSLDAISILCGRLSSYSWVVIAVKSSAWLLAFLSFIEPPHWCRSQAFAMGYTDNDPGRESCIEAFKERGPSMEDASIDVEYYPNATWIVLTMHQAFVMELVLVTIVTIFSLLRFGRNGFRWKIHCQRNAQGINRLVQFCSVAAIYVGLFANFTRFHPFLRLFVLTTFQYSFQREFRTFLRMIPDIVYILALLSVILFFYAWFGTVIFYGTDTGTLYFPNLVESLWTLWQMVTTVNYPDVMMISYNQSRLAGLFYVSFMGISLFFIMNLILATVVNAYDSAIARRKEMRAKHAKGNLAKAFHLMDADGTGEITSETIMAVFYILNNDFPDFRYIPEEETKILFGVLDKDGSSKINLNEFLDFGNVLLLQLTKESEYATFVETNLPKLFASQPYQMFCDFVRSIAFEYAVDAILVLNAIVIGIQSYPELAGEGGDIDPQYADGNIDTIWEAFETVFTVLYILEVQAKITVFGWKLYAESPRNIFDFSVTVAAVAATCYVYYPNGYYDSRLIRLIVMARVLRLLRLLFAVPQFQLIGRIAAEILPTAGSVLMFLFFLLYFFAALGMSLYGGMITRDPSNELAPRLVGSDFAEAEYWANNFNDMMSSMNVLFNLLVINNWMVCEEGFELTTGGKWVRWYFLSFHVMGVILVNNLVQAVVINSFFQQLQNMDAHANDEAVGGEAVLQYQTARFDASEVTGTKTGASGGYMARVRAIHSDIDLDERERLRNLFTQQSSDIKKGDEQ